MQNYAQSEILHGQSNRKCNGLNTLLISDIQRCQKKNYVQFVQSTYLETKPTMEHWLATAAGSFSGELWWIWWSLATRSENSVGSSNLIAKKSIVHLVDLTCVYSKGFQLILAYQNNVLQGRDAVASCEYSQDTKGSHHN